MSSKCVELLVLETAWTNGFANDRENGVRPQFSVEPELRAMAQNCSDSDFVIYYRQLLTSYDLKYWLKKAPEGSFVYIACHGESRGLALPSGEHVKKKALKDILESSPFKGLIVSCCGDLGRDWYPGNEFEGRWILHHAHEHLPWDAVFLDRSVFTWMAKKGKSSETLFKAGMTAKDGCSLNYTQFAEQLRSTFVVQRNGAWVPVIKPADR